MSTPPNRNRVLWSASPSTLINLPLFIMCLLFFWLILPLFLALWAWVSTRSIRYELTKERLGVKSGVLNKKQDWLELYRVKDIQVDRPFFLRIIGKGNVHLDTSDRSHPVFTIKGVSDTEELSHQIRDLVEVMREAKGVREFD